MVRVLINVRMVGGVGVAATWTGDLPWPSAPEQGAGWVHCTGWAVETVKSTYFYGPTLDPMDPDVAITVHAGAEVVDHLVGEHQFTDRR